MSIIERPAAERRTIDVGQRERDWSWLPKVELHCHIEGTMRPRTLSELATLNSVSLPTFDVDSLFRPNDRGTVWEVSSLVRSVLRTPDDWERLAFESVCDGADVGLRYREAFFSPTPQLQNGQDLGDIVAALDRGLRVAERITGVRCSLIFDIDAAAGPDVADAHIARLVELRRSGRAGFHRVIGIGMGSTEHGVDALSFSAAYARAGRAGLRRTAHQDDRSGPAAIIAALDGLGCERIDGGSAILDDAELTARFDDEQIPITACPGARMRTEPGTEEERERRLFEAMRDADLLATLNTDVPALVGLDLGQEYAWCADSFGYGTADMVEIALDGVRASWLDDGEVAVLMGEIKAAAASHSHRTSLLS